MAANRSRLLAQTRRDARQERIHGCPAHRTLRTGVYPETKARYAAWKAKAIDEGMREGIKKGRREGIEKGRREGIEKGKREGERALVRKQLVLRFGELPADAERRLERASLAKLERWAERVLTAKNLAAVFAD